MILADIDELLSSSGGVRVNGQQVVCGDDINCASAIIGHVSRSECCMTFENGLSYTIFGVEGCFVCIGMSACDNIHFCNF